MRHDEMLKSIADSVAQKFCSYHGSYYLLALPRTAASRLTQLEARNRNPEMLPTERDTNRLLFSAPRMIYENDSPIHKRWAQKWEASVRGETKFQTRRFFFQRYRESWRHHIITNFRLAVSKATPDARRPLGSGGTILWIYIDPLCQSESSGTTY